MSKNKQNNKHIASTEAKQKKLLQEEFGTEMGDPKAAKIYESLGKTKSDKEPEKKKKFKRKKTRISKVLKYNWKAKCLYRC